jgi:hypothetical protein
MDNITYGPSEQRKYAFSDAGPAMSLKLIYWFWQAGRLMMVVLSRNAWQWVVTSE